MNTHNNGFSKILLIIIIAAGCLYFVKDTNNISLLEKMVMYYPNKYKEAKDGVEDIKVQKENREGVINEYMQ